MSDRAGISIQTRSVDSVWRKIKTAALFGMAIVAMGRSVSAFAEESSNTAKEQLKAVWTEYADAQRTLYQSKAWANAYIQTFVEEESWENLVRARIACRLAASNIRELELTEQLSDEARAALDQESVDYMYILAETADFASLKEEESKILSDQRFVELVEQAFCQDYVEALGDTVTLEEKRDALFLQNLEVEEQYFRITMGEQTKEASVEELGQESTAILDQIEALEEEQTHIKAQKDAIKELISQNVQNGETQWFEKENVQMADAPEYLPFPDWYFAEDYGYAYFVQQEDGTMNYLEYGDDLKAEMSEGIYGIYAQGPTITADETESYLRTVQDMADVILKGENMWVDTGDYSLQIERTEDATTMTVLGADLPFAPGYVF